MLVELIDVEVADFRHARPRQPQNEWEHPRASSWRGAGERPEKMESRERGWKEAGRRLERGWREAGERLGGGCSLSLSAPTPCCCCFSSLALLPHHAAAASPLSLLAHPAAAASPLSLLPHPEPTNQPPSQPTNRPINPRPVKHGAAKSDQMIRRLWGSWCQNRCEAPP